MSNNDNGYKAAQRAYDMQEPPEDPYIECEDCAGDGTMFDSDSGEVLCCKRCEGAGRVERPSKRIIDERDADELLD